MIINKSNQGHIRLEASKSQKNMNTLISRFKEQASKESTKIPLKAPGKDKGTSKKRQKKGRYPKLIANIKLRKKFKLESPHRYVLLIKY
jgi:hypothetical protein